MYSISRTDQYFNPVDELGAGAAQPMDVALDRLIGTAEGDLDLEVLVNPLGCQTRLELSQDQRGVIGTKAFSPRSPGGRKWVILVPIGGGAGGLKWVSFIPRAGR